jgi:hypothetical protein
MNTDQLDETLALFAERVYVKTQGNPAKVNIQYAMAEAKAQIEQLIKEEVEKQQPLYTRKRISDGICRNGHIGQYAKNSKGWNYCKQCHKDHRTNKNTKTNQT